MFKKQFDLGPFNCLIKSVSELFVYPRNSLYLQLAHVLPTELKVQIFCRVGNIVVYHLGGIYMSELLCYLRVYLPVNQMML